MKTRVIAATFILGLGAVTMALGQPGTKEAAPRSVAADASAAVPAARPAAGSAELHERVARLRAEVELLQIEHDRARERLNAGLNERDNAAANPSRQVAREFMRIGAELVGKDSEFEAAMQARGDEVWKALDKVVAPIPSADVERLRQDFLRVATELNRKKIELVTLEVHLDGSM